MWRPAPVTAGSRTRVRNVAECYVIFTVLSNHALVRHEHMSWIYERFLFIHFKVKVVLVPLVRIVVYMWCSVLIWTCQHCTTRLGSRPDCTAVWRNWYQYMGWLAAKVTAYSMGFIQTRRQWPKWWRRLLWLSKLGDSLNDNVLRSDEGQWVVLKKTGTIELSS